MAALTWFVTNNLASVHQDMSEASPGAEAYASPVYGWIVGTNAAGNYSEARAQTEQVTSSFHATPIDPDGSINTGTGDCWRTTNTYNGTFDTGNWEFYLACRANTNATGQDGNAGFRLFRSSNADGSSATEITSARHEGSAVTDLLTTVTQTSSITTVNITSFSVTNEYLFVQVGWEITGAATMSSADVDIRIGTGATRVVSPNFTASSVTGTGWYGSHNGGW